MVIIIEDEKPAAEKLVNALHQYDKAIQVQAILGSIESAMEWFRHHPMPALIFMDIELSDGISFRLFDGCNITCPVIFTTAYDDYWQEAFAYNSIEYLLKPIRQNKLEAALKKYDALSRYFASHFQQMMQGHQLKEKYKKRFLVKRGTDYITIKCDDIACFYATHKLVCLLDCNNQKFILDKSLADIEKEVDPSQFYRVNRKYLVNITAIKKIKAFTKSKLQLLLEPPASEDIVISQENVAAFKNWMGG